MVKNSCGRLTYRLREFFAKPKKNKAVFLGILALPADLRFIKFLPPEIYRKGR